MAGKSGAITSTDVRKKKSDEIPEEIAELTELERTINPTREASKVLDGTDVEKYLVKMERANASWTTPTGIIFTQKNPFQLVEETELDSLLDQGGFRRADPKELIKFYGK